MAPLEQEAPLVWDWDVEHEDRRAEAKADAAVHGATPFQVDRKLLKDIVHERMGAEVARIKFLGAGSSNSISSSSPQIPISPVCCCRYIP